MINTICIPINGSAGVGKDTFVDMVIARLRASGYTASKSSSVDLVKTAALTLGWDGTKDEKGRQFLSDLKDLSIRFYDGPMNYMKQTVATAGDDVMFFHIREPKEISRFLATFPGAVSVLVKRDGVQQFNNHADRNVDKTLYDFVIDNNGTLAELEASAAAFTDTICRHLAYHSKKGAA